MIVEASRLALMAVALHCDDDERIADCKNTTCVSTVLISLYGTIFRIVVAYCGWSLVAIGSEAVVDGENFNKIEQQETKRQSSAPSSPRPRSGRQRSAHRDDAGARAACAARIPLRRR